jgi:alpha-glucosidase
VGSAAGLDAWKGTIQLDFLTNGKVYTATIYEDNAQSGITKRTVAVHKGTKLPFTIAAKGGQAILIEPAL